MRASNLHDLYVSELRDLYSAETQLVDALPKMAKAASYPHLRSAFQAHLAQTHGHVARLDTILGQLGIKPDGKTCKAMKGLLAEGEEVIRDTDESTRDAGLIAAAQRVEHYEIAGYGCVRTYADQLGYQDAMSLLQMTLNEEGQTDKKLTALAETVCNVEAEQAR